jgi:hypothetical protein
LPISVAEIQSRILNLLVSVRQSLS